MLRLVRHVTTEIPSHNNVPNGGENSKIVSDVRALQRDVLYKRLTKLGCTSCRIPS